MKKKSMGLEILALNTQVSLGNEVEMEVFTLGLR
jgi:hypothetical protein